MNGKRTARLGGAVVLAVAAIVVPAAARGGTGVWGGPGGSASTYTPTTSRVAVTTSGVEANGESNSPSLTQDGRFVAFASDSTNLVPGDTNAHTDIYVRDRTNNTTERVSVSATGAQLDDLSFTPEIAPNGRFVAFLSWATNVTSDISGNQQQLYVRDLVNRTTVRISKNASGVSANGPSSNPELSADGRFVAFQSDATNLVQGDTNGSEDIFRRDLTTGVTRRVSVTSGGNQGTGDADFASISNDGRFIAFTTDGALHPADTNGDLDVYVWDATTLRTTPVSVNASGQFVPGQSASAAVSGNGQKVAFSSSSALEASDTNGMSDVYVRTLASGSNARVSLGGGNVQGNGHSFEPTIDASGSAVTFLSSATNLVPGDTNGVRDAFRRVGTSTDRVSVSSGGAQGNGHVEEVAISGTGAVIVFRSGSTNLVSPDASAQQELFARAY
jgi:Tol biopolymer transport system component